MVIAFGKWGDSLAFRIPAPIAKEIGVTENGLATLSVKEGKLVIEPITDEIDLEQLVAGITDDNRHEEISTGYAVGSELR
jgi:antitoxin MazE